MADTEGTITAEVATSIVLGQTIYDRNGEKVGTVDDLDRHTGWMKAEVNPLSNEPLYIPLRLVTNIDPHELYLSQSIEELRRNYADPPTRSTQVEKILGETVATTRQASGYDGQPVVVEEANVDRIRRRIVVGDLVLTSDQIDLGTVKRYDATTGWMLITRRLQTPNDLMVPVAAVGHVDSAAAEIYLAASRADLRAMQHLEPVDVVFVDSPSVAAS